MSEADLRMLYLELIKNCILGFIVEDESIISFPSFSLAEGILTPQKFNRKIRERGLDLPSTAHSMIGL